MYSFIDLKLVLRKKTTLEKKKAQYHLGETYQLSRALQVGFIWEDHF